MYNHTKKICNYTIKKHYPLNWIDILQYPNLKIQIGEKGKFMDS